MRFYSGIDLHSNNSVVSVINEEGLTVFQKRLNNDIETIKLVLLPYKTSLMGIVVESTYNWYWLVDGLQDAGFVVHLANTTAIQQYSGLKHTNDNTDARWLAELLRLDILPSGYICPIEHRATRDLALVAICVYFSISIKKKMRLQKRYYNNSNYQKNTKN